MEKCVDTSWNVDSRHLGRAASYDHFMRVAVMLALISIACGGSNVTEVEEVELQLLQDSNAELGRWSNGAASLAGHPPDISRSVEAFVSPTHSLKIGFDGLFHNRQEARWTQVLSIDSTRFAATDFTLEAFVKIDSIRGCGVALSIIADDSFDDFDPDSIAVYVTTADEQTIKGTHDWRPYQLILPSLPSGIAVLQVSLETLPGTVGTVYFDDITLRVRAPR